MEQVRVFRVLPYPVLDERAQGHHLPGALRAHIVQRVSRQSTANTMALESRSDLSVGEHHKLVGDLVLGEAGEFCVDMCLDRDSGWLCDSSSMAQQCHEDDERAACRESDP